MTNTIHYKILEIRKAVQKATKTGRNDRQNYAYVTEADVLEAIREAMDAQGIGCYFTCDQMVEMGQALYIQGSYIVYDADGNFISVPWAGEGEPPGKRLYKAYTGCSKYFHLKFFGLYTEDDPEKDNEPKPKQQPKPALTQKITTEPAKKMMAEAQQVKPPAASLDVNYDSQNGLPAVTFADEEAVLNCKIDPGSATFNDDKAFVKSLGARWNGSSKVWQIFTTDPAGMLAQLQQKPHITVTTEDIPF